MKQLRETFGKSVIPFEVPIVENGEIIGSDQCAAVIKRGIIRGRWRILTRRSRFRMTWWTSVNGYKDQIAEAVAMGDDELMEKFFSGESFSEAELTRGVRLGVRNGEIRPVFSGSALQSIGIERLMDLIIKYFPAYGESGNYAAHR